MKKKGYCVSCSIDVRTFLVYPVGLKGGPPRRWGGLGRVSKVCQVTILVQSCGESGWSPKRNKEMLAEKQY